MSQKQKRSLIFRILSKLTKATTSPNQSQDNSISKEVKNDTVGNYNIEKLLIEEFRYRGNYSLQIVQAFTNSFNLYFVLLGISVSGLGITFQLIGKTQSFLEPLILLMFIIFGIANFLFFVWFITLVNVYIRNKTCMNMIREHYIKKNQNQISDINYSLQFSMNYGATFKYRFILYSVLTLADSLCFAGAAFISAEIWLHINNGSLYPLPSDLRPYFFALIVILIVPILHILFYRFTIYESERNPSKTYISLFNA
jgi:hypothetical protein